MNRRRFLAAVSGGSLGSIAGCLGVGLPGTERQSANPTSTSEADRASDDVTLAETGIPSTICEESVRERPGIYAIVDPAFDRSWAGYDLPGQYDDGLAEDDVVVGIEREGLARAYPLRVLFYHEVVNDVVAGRPLIVTYCPLCSSGLVADRVVDGEATTFHVSGLLWMPPGLQTEVSKYEGTVFGVNRKETDAEVRNHGNLVMYDRETRSYWSQMLATAICGPRRTDELRIRPSTVTTWGEWRGSHDGAQVLLPPPESTTDRAAGIR